LTRSSHSFLNSKCIFDIKRDRWVSLSLSLVIMGKRKWKYITDKHIPSHLASSWPTFINRHFDFYLYVLSRKQTGYTPKETRREEDAISNIHAHFIMIESRFDHIHLDQSFFFSSSSLYLLFDILIVNSAYLNDNSPYNDNILK